MRTVDVTGRHGFLDQFDHELLGRQLRIVQGSSHLWMTARIDPDRSEEACIRRILTIQGVSGIQNSVETLEERRFASNSVVEASRNQPLNVLQNRDVEVGLGWEVVVQGRRGDARLPGDVPVGGDLVPVHGEGLPCDDQDPTTGFGRVGGRRPTQSPSLLATTRHAASMAGAAICQRVERSGTVALLIGRSITVEP